MSALESPVEIPLRPNPAGARPGDYGGKCIHFNGILNSHCRAGLEYSAIRVANGGDKLPCLGRADAECPSFRFPTAEQVAAFETDATAAVTHHFDAIDRGVCPAHGTPITLRQVGRSVYAVECGCRLYQGTIPTARPASQAAASRQPPVRYAPPTDTALDRAAVAALATCTFLPGSWEKRFTRSLSKRDCAGAACPIQLTAKQRSWLWTFARRYRQQIRDTAVLAALTGLRPAAIEESA